MATFKLITYETGEGPRAGVLCGDAAFDVAGATGEPRYTSVMGILNDWDRAKRTLANPPTALGRTRPVRSTAATCGCWRPCPCRAPSTAPAPTIAITSRKWRGAEHPAGAGSAHARPEILALHQVTRAASRRLMSSFRCHGIPEGGLGGRARRRHRQGGAQRADGARPRRGRRLHHRQRPVGARRVATPGHFRHVAVRSTGSAKSASTVPVRSGRGSCWPTTSRIRTSSRSS